jgi:hypothetical protein
LNFSRSLLFSFAIPFTHTGGLLSYSFTDWFSVTAGVVEGWDVSDDNNASPAYTGQFAVTPLKDLSTALNWIVGPEQNSNNTRQRWVTDLTANYAGFKDGDASWWGWAIYAAYDWTEKFRSALRFEFFDDPQSVRTAIRNTGNRTSIYEVTATAQYKIWKGLVGRVEYRHDDANAKVFAIRAPSYAPTERVQDTLSVDLYYLFF